VSQRHFTGGEEYFEQCGQLGIIRNYYKVRSKTYCQSKEKSAWSPFMVIGFHAVGSWYLLVVLVAVVRLSGGWRA